MSWRRLIPGHFRYRPAWHVRLNRCTVTVIRTEWVLWRWVIALDYLVQVDGCFICRHESEARARLAAVDFVVSTTYAELV